MGPMQFVMIGHVDTGKSTVSGQLLAKAGWVDQRELDKIQDKADKDGMGKWKWARVLDLYEEELLRGKTHEFISIPFSWNDREYELIDTPGHLTFIRSMISGISTGVRVACLLVSMQDGEFAASFEKGTLKEHLIIAYTFGIQHIVILANKMDVIDWNEEKFNQKCDKVMAFLSKLGYKDENVSRIPVSGWLGMGLTDTENLPEWYQGMSVMDTLDKIQITKQEEEYEFKGEKFVIEMKLLNYDSILSSGFRCIVHSQGEEYEVTLMGIRGQKFIKSGEKAITLWKTSPITLNSNRLLFRKDTQTIGLGKIVEVLGNK